MTIPSYFHALNDYKRADHYLELNAAGEVKRNDLNKGCCAFIANLIAAIWRAVTKSSTNMDKIVDHLIKKLNEINTKELKPEDKEKLISILKNLGAQLAGQHIFAIVFNRKAALIEMDSHPPYHVEAVIPVPPKVLLSPPPGVITPVEKPRVADPKPDTAHWFPGKILSPAEIRLHCKAPFKKEGLKSGDLLIARRTNGDHQLVAFVNIVGDRIEFIHPREGLLNKDVSEFYNVKEVPKPHKKDPEIPHDELDPIPENEGVGDRTRIVGNWFVQKLEGYIPNADPSVMGKLRYAGVDYELLNGATKDISTKSVALVGGYNQEVILLNPHRSPKINLLYDVLKGVIEGQKKRGVSLSDEQILNLVLVHISRFVLEIDDQEIGLPEHVRGMPGCDVLRVNNTGEPKMSDRIAVIPLEKQVIAHKGVCRHNALLAAYYIDRLIKDKVLDGTVQFIRDNLDKGGAHAWVMFVPEKKAGTEPAIWHVDVYWKELGNLEKPQTMEIFLDLYGPKALSNTLLRLQGTAKKHKQLQALETYAKVVVGRLK